MIETIDERHIDLKIKRNNGNHFPLIICPNKFICLLCPIEFFIVYFFIAVIIIVSLIAFILRYKQSDKQNWQINIYLSLFLTVTILYFFISHFNPGIVVQNEQNDNRFDYLNRFCQKCQLKIKITTKHCSQCNMCIAKYDHHCGFFGTCIGKYNLNIFYFFILIMLTWFAFTIYMFVKIAK